MKKKENELKNINDIPKQMELNTNLISKEEEHNNLKLQNKNKNANEKIVRGKEKIITNKQINNENKKNNKSEIEDENFKENESKNENNQINSERNQTNNTYIIKTKEPNLIKTELRSFLFNEIEFEKMIEIPIDLIDLINYGSIIKFIKENVLFSFLGDTAILSFTALTNQTELLILELLKKNDILFKVLNKIFNHTNPQSHSHNFLFSIFFNLVKTMKINHQFQTYFFEEINGEYILKILQHGLENSQNTIQIQTLEILHELFFQNSNNIRKYLINKNQQQENYQFFHSLSLMIKKKSVQSNVKFLIIDLFKLLLDPQNLENWVPKERFIQIFYENILQDLFEQIYDFIEDEKKKNKKNNRSLNNTEIVSDKYSYNYSETETDNITETYSDNGTDIETEIEKINEIVNDNKNYKPVKDNKNHKNEIEDENIRIKKMANHNQNQENVEENELKKQKEVEMKERGGRENNFKTVLENENEKGSGNNNNNMIETQIDKEIERGGNIVGIEFEIQNKKQENKLKLIKEKEEINKIELKTEKKIDQKVVDNKLQNKSENTNGNENENENKNKNENKNINEKKDENENENENDKNDENHLIDLHGLNNKIDIMDQNQVIVLVFDFLLFCLLKHNRRFFFQATGIFSKFDVLLDSPTVGVCLASTRFFKSFMLLLDTASIRYSLTNNLWDKFINNVKKYGKKNVMLSSCFLEIFEKLRILNFKSVITHIVNKYEKWIETITYTQVFHNILELDKKNQEDDFNNNFFDEKANSSLSDSKNNELSEPEVFFNYYPTKIYNLHDLSQQIIGGGNSNENGNEKGKGKEKENEKENENEKKKEKEMIIQEKEKVIINDNKKIEKNNKKLFEQGSEESNLERKRSFGEWVEENDDEIDDEQDEKLNVKDINNNNNNNYIKINNENENENDGKKLNQDHLVGRNYQKQSPNFLEKKEQNKNSVKKEINNINKKVMFTKKKSRVNDHSSFKSSLNSKPSNKNHKKMQKTFIEK
ncbi:atp synthase gamma-related [Anaeramoeba flamelloides]|uniref:Atp synthase gamma-related n=1 Tax=Anaeramoeba flamelloides TaxID=1746091 RepID=A0AAV7ZL00_9EUKA|nr:atp synthase gamma-related [Anaeramoeba flamelloides]